jgi:hypothetical protein
MSRAPASKNSTNGTLPPTTAIAASPASRERCRGAATTLCPLAPARPQIASSTAAAMVFFAVV